MFVYTGGYPPGKDQKIPSGNPSGKIDPSTEKSEDFRRFNQNWGSNLVDFFFLRDKIIIFKKRHCYKDLYIYTKIPTGYFLLLFFVFVGLVTFFRLVFVVMDWMTTNYLRSLELFVGDPANYSSPSFHRCHGIDLLKVEMSILVVVGLPNIDSQHLI